MSNSKRAVRVSDFEKALMEWRQNYLDGYGQEPSDIDAARWARKWFESRPVFTENKELCEENERLKQGLRVASDTHNRDMKTIGKLREENARLNKVLERVGLSAQMVEDMALIDELKAENERLKASNAELVGVLKTVQHISWKYDGNRWGIIEDVLKTNQGGEG